MIALKFDDSGAVVAWKYPCRDLAELKPTSEGFALYDWEGEEKEIGYLTLRDGRLKTNETEREAARAHAENMRRIAIIKNKLLELDMDINACMDGVGKVKTESEYRAERILLRNELRVLEGKEPLKGKGEAE